MVVGTAVVVGALHVHGIYRDPTNDYGAADLAAIGQSSGIGDAAAPVAGNATASVVPAAAPSSTTAAVGMPNTGGASSDGGPMWLVALLALAALAGGALMLRSRAAVGNPR